MTLDDKVDRLVTACKHLLVPWYLILSYAYYFENVSMVTDEFYDRLCKDLLDCINANEIEHCHLSLCDPEALVAGTAFQLLKTDYPFMAVSCAKQFIKEGYGK